MPPTRGRARIRLPVARVQLRKLDPRQLLKGIVGGEIRLPRGFEEEERVLTEEVSRVSGYVMLTQSFCHFPVQTAQFRDAPVSF